MPHFWREPVVATAAPGVLAYGKSIRVGRRSMEWRCHSKNAWRPVPAEEWWGWSRTEAPSV